jgi:hypothetical protein
VSLAAVRSPVLPAALNTASALSELVGRVPAALISCRSVIPEGGVIVFAADVPKNASRPASGCVVVIEGAAIVVTSFWSRPAWAAIGTVRSTPP